MNAIVYNRYGSAEELFLTTVAKPSPKPHEVLVKVQASTVTAGDVRMRSFRVPASQWLFARLYLGLFRPRFRVPGMEISGTVEAVGSLVTRFKAGDRVFANTLAHGFGGNADYKCLPENGAIALAPSTIPLALAATVPVGGGTALRLLMKAGIAPGKRVLVVGAAGSVGSYTLQLARYFGAGTTAVVSTKNLELAAWLGAARVIDYLAYDFTRLHRRFDIIVDAAGKSARSEVKHLLARGGRFVTVAANAGKPGFAELEMLRTIIENGGVKPLVSAEFPLERIREAHRLVDAGHKTGNVLIHVSKPEKNTRAEHPFPGALNLTAGDKIGARIIS